MIILYNCIWEKRNAALPIHSTKNKESVHKRSLTLFSNLVLSSGIPTEFRLFVFEKRLKNNAHR